MRKPLIYDEFLKMRPQFDNVRFENNCLIIDDFYENPEEIYEHLRNRDYPMWKHNLERDSDNGERYLDTRIIDRISFATRVHQAEQERILNMCRKYWWNGGYFWEDNFEVNCFKTLTEFDTKYQHYPHIDTELDVPDECSTLNMIVYLDKEESGGTAVYHGEWIQNNEQKALLYPVEELFEIDYVIPHKFNRCVIFPGNRMHGAYIDDYNAYSGDKWRYTQVRFFHPKN